MKMLHWSYFLLLVLHNHVVFTATQMPPDEPGSSQPNIIYYNTGKTTEWSQFYNNTLTVIKFLYTHNPANGFATSLGYGDFPDTAYGHSGCYNMSDQSGCAQCIQQCFQTIQRAAPLALGGVFWFNSSDNRCRLRYESYNFTSEDVTLGVLGVVGPNISTPSPPPLVPAAPLVDSPSVDRSGSSQNSSSKTISGGVIGGVASGGVLLFLAVGFVVWRWRSKDTMKLDERHRYKGQPGPAPGSDLEGGSIEGPIVFKYGELSQATNNFSDASKLGQGGFGAVYKACLNDGTQVAVKKLSLQSHQGRIEFVNEINIITGIRHRNLVTLKGYCVEGDERLLVYELLENGSLNQALFGSCGRPLTWHSRFQIALGVARGLAYLHEESNIQIIHRDIKASNILLDQKLQPKISDFGVSKFFDVDKGFTSTKVAGTFGYMAPEYVTRGKLTSKADVFSYGILVLEIVSGRKCVDSTRPPEEELLLQHVWNLHGDDKLEDYVDKRLGKNYVADEVSRLTSIAMLCTQDDQDFRPAMSHVVAMLQGYLEIVQFPSQSPSYFARVPQVSSNSTTASDIDTTAIKSG